MAERGANILTNTLEKPSIFELVSADSLHNTFYPAFKRISQHFSSTNPERYGFLVKYYDEIFLVLNATVQNYYLNRYGELQANSI